MSRYLSSMETSNTAMKLRKAAVKARHQNELNDLRNRMQKEIDQSINELKMASDVRRMQAIESQVRLYPFNWPFNRNFFLFSTLFYYLSVLMNCFQTVNNNNNNNNNASLFHRKIKLHILCYNKRR